MEPGRTLIFGIKVAAAAVTGWWLGMPNAFRLLLLLQVADVAMGLLVAQKNGHIRSATMQLGISKKIAAWILVFIVHQFEANALGLVLTDAGFAPLPLDSIAAIGFAVAEAISITENAQLMGWRIPKFLADGLDIAQDKIFGVEEETEEGDA